MQKQVEREWELTIDPDTVRLFILKAKAISAAMSDDYQDGSEHEIELDDQTHDGHHHDGLAEEESEDLTSEELRELIDDLNVDEAAELVALVWVGRGDYDAAEWPTPASGRTSAPRPICSACRRWPTGWRKAWKRSAPEPEPLTSKVESLSQADESELPKPLLRHCSPTSFDAGPNPATGMNVAAELSFTLP